jgi:hypothetical protein
VPYFTSTACVFATSLNQITAIYPSNTAAIMQYNDVASSDSATAVTYAPSVTSIVIYTTFTGAVTNCFVGQDRHSCNMLVNICALQKYAQGSAPCVALGALMSGILIYDHGFVGNYPYTGPIGWKDTLPFVYESSNILTTTAILIQQSVTLANTVTVDNSATGVLSFRLYMYTYNGTYLGWQPLGSQLQLCGGDLKLLNNYLRFGTK